MPVFYFNVIAGGQEVTDFEGTELPDLEAARTDAIADARELMSAAILDGRYISQRQIEICGEGGGLLLVVRFADAIKPAE